MLFFSFFLAYIFGQALGNVALGFAAVTLLVLLLLLLFWHMRTKWVILPITDMMTNLFTVDDQPLETEKVSKELRESRARMNDNFQQMMHTGERPANRVDAVTSWVSRGVAAYEGLRIGLSVIRAIGTIFGRKRRRR